jgi:hypothetical protein
VQNVCFCSRDSLNDESDVCVRVCVCVCVCVRACVSIQVNVYSSILSKLIGVSEKIEMFISADPIQIYVKSSPLRYASIHPPSHPRVNTALHPRQPDVACFCGSFMFFYGCGRPPLANWRRLSGNCRYSTSNMTPSPDCFRIGRAGGRTGC